LYKSLYNKETTIADCLLTIANKCEECSISNFCENQEDFSKILDDLSPGALELIAESFISTPFTKKVVNTVWNSDQSLITFRKNSSILTEEECNQKIKERLQG
jgi:hypothetical protein